jgi:phage FluMu gp28-like protein
VKRSRAKSRRSQRSPIASKARRLSATKSADRKESHSSTSSPLPGSSISSTVSTQILLPTSKLQLYPYQKAWIADNSRLKIADKARRIGYSFAAGLALVRDCIRRKTTAIVLSRGERQAKLFIEESVALHVRSIGIMNQLVEGSLPGTSIFKEEIDFSNGSKIIALPSEPGYREEL